jgi:hypothetical protein
VKPIYWKSIILGLAGVLIIVALYLFSAYMADQDMNEFNRIPRSYDNFMVGVNWWLFFFVAVLVVLALLGAFSAWASSHDITSARVTIIASALAGGVPVALATIGIVSIFAIAFITTPEDHRMSFFSSPFPLLLPILAYAFIGLMMSIAGGALYKLVAKALFNRKAPGSR